MPGQVGAPGKEGLIGPKVQQLLIMNMMGVESGRIEKVMIGSRRTVALGGTCVAVLEISGEIGVTVES